MIGVKHANAKYYAFVNNDVVFLNDCLSILKREIENNQHIGVCGPKNYTTKGEFLSTLDHFSSLKKEILGRKFLEFINPKEYPNRRFLYSKTQKGQLISGSFMMIRASDFITVKGFDPNIFLYYEETDLCLRLLKINKKAYLIPEAKFIHYHGASTPKNITIKSELKISLLYVIRKHYGYLNYKILLTYLQIRYFITSFFKPKYWHLFKILFKGAPLTDSMKNKQEYR
ncbi:glycosyltransferase family 2 protein [uncultured Flavobacterium sp.]|uniref:glycosyltransferase n=1 Tax=uncultured Flavobacterium sp. TaxID=165435 RepID=UPI0030CA313D